MMRLMRLRSNARFAHLREIAKPNLALLHLFAIANTVNTLLDARHEPLKTAWYSALVTKRADLGKK